MTLQASIHLSRVCLGLAGNSPTVIVSGSAGSVGGGGQRNHEREIEGEFRQYAQGTTRLLTGTGKTRTEQLTLRALTPTQMTNLRSMAGQTCLFRDTYGRRFYGAFLITDETSIPLSGATSASVITDVSLSITAVTYTEGI